MFFPEINDTEQPRGNPSIFVFNFETIWFVNIHRRECTWFTGGSSLGGDYFIHPGLDYNIINTF